MMKHLFHGTNATDPRLIYESEYGLDARFSNPGAYGNGIYFSKSSAYSNKFAYRLPNGDYQMFMALVSVGDIVTFDNGQYRIPPLKPGSMVERYDSINNGNEGHYIIYDNVKAYPGYLITYK